MASLISGFEYDIFISYRQKDNKYDGWVTEFVNNLRKELEATFKEEVSVYFDINPHDGLLETHDVDASLKDKLKCLIFIPIISRTYCDPKSFAWEHEFKAFVSQASHDQFGLKIKLQGGNVASRILPIKIHELDADDKDLLEAEMGGVLRSVEFIYTSAGVNRPLRSTEEHSDENINRIIYRDQINKVANAIKEIIYSIVLPPKSGSKKITRTENINSRKKPIKIRKRFGTRYVIGTIFIILLLVFWGTKNLIGKNKLSNSIIVLPFTTHDTIQSYFAEGIAVDVITELAKVKSISTLSWNTSATYVRSNKTLEDIAEETGVSYVLTGIIQREGQNIRVNVALVNPKTGKNIWVQSWDQELKYVFDIQKQIAKEVAGELGVELSSEENTRLERYQTRNFEAYDLFLQARTESRKMKWGPEFLHRSMQLLDDALAIDPDFPKALTLRANVLIDIALYEDVDPLEQAAKAKNDLYRSLSLDPDYSDTYIVMGIVNYWLEWNFKEAKINLEKGWELSNYGDAPITQCFCGIIEFNMATGNFLRALTLLSKVEKIDPDYPYSVEEKLTIYEFLNDTANIRKLLKSFSGKESEMVNFYYVLGNHRKVIELLKEPVKGGEGGRTSWLLSKLASSYYSVGMVEKSDSIVNHLISLSERKRNIDYNIALIFAARGDKENAIKWYTNAYKKHDPNITSTLFETDLRSLSKEPEIQNILKEIGIYDTSSEN